jgi:hypothetical protein
MYYKGKIRSIKNPNVCLTMIYTEIDYHVALKIETTASSQL